jgi:hypothetical protein
MHRWQKLFAIGLVAGTVLSLVVFNALEPTQYNRGLQHWDTKASDETSAPPPGSRLSDTAAAKLQGVLQHLRTASSELPAVRTFLREPRVYFRAYSTPLHTAEPVTPRRTARRGHGESHSRMPRGRASLHLRPIPCVQQGKIHRVDPNSQVDPAV